MPWKIEIPYDRRSPYTADDEDDAADIIVQSDQYLDNYEYDYSSYNESIDEQYQAETGNAQVCIRGQEWYPSEVFKKMDEYSYDEGYDEERRYYAGESRDEIVENLDENEYEGGVAYLYGGITATYFEVVDEDEEIDEDESELIDEVFG